VRRDRIKTTYAKKKRIRLIRVKYTERRIELYLKKLIRRAFPAQ